MQDPPAGADRYYAAPMPVPTTATPPEAPPGDLTARVQHNARQLANLLRVRGVADGDTSLHAVVDGRHAFEGGQHAAAAAAAAGVRLAEGEGAVARSHTAVFASRGADGPAYNGDVALMAWPPPSTRDKVDPEQGEAALSYCDGEGKPLYSPAIVFGVMSYAAGEDNSFVLLDACPGNPGGVKGGQASGHRNMECPKKAFKHNAYRATGLGLAQRIHEGHATRLYVGSVDVWDNMHLERALRSHELDVVDETDATAELLAPWLEAAAAAAAIDISPSVQASGSLYHALRGSLRVRRVVDAGGATVAVLVGTCHASAFCSMGRYEAGLVDVGILGAATLFDVMGRDVDDFTRVTDLRRFDATMAESHHDMCVRGGHATAELVRIHREEMGDDAFQVEVALAAAAYGTPAFGAFHPALRAGVYNVLC